VKGGDVLYDAEVCEEKRRSKGTGKEHTNIRGNALAGGNA
jgi:hypothetical protein